jgi:tRNA nucleotidyltransferase/poly(A) polymerase
MSDYIFMLESHLNPDQNRVVEEVHKAAAEANTNLFLTGGAMRDMIGGFRIRDLDFSVEGNALKLASTVAQRLGAVSVAEDEHRKSAELVFPSGVTAQIAMSRLERQGRGGGKPQVSAATIQEDLRGRDFTVNAIALSLNRASRGLLLDPTNGLADLERRELRLISSYGFHDDPVRMLRMIRFRVRLGFEIEERTRTHFENARAAGIEKSIPPRALGEELKRIAVEDQPSEILRALQEAGMLELFSPALAGAKAQFAALVKFEKAARLAPDDARSRAARLGPFLFVLAEKLTPKERQALVKATEMRKAETDLWQKLDSRARKLESALKSARIRKPSHVYHILSKAAPDEVLFLLYHSAYKPVQERIRNHYQKYLPAVQEMTPEDFAGLTGTPGTPKHERAREELIATRLDRRPRKPVVPEAPPPVEAAAMRGRVVR